MLVAHRTCSCRHEPTEVTAIQLRWQVLVHCNVVVSSLVVQAPGVPASLHVVYYRFPLPSHGWFVNVRWPL